MKTRVHDADVWREAAAAGNLIYVGKYQTPSQIPNLRSRNIFGVPLECDSIYSTRSSLK